MAKIKNNQLAYEYILRRIENGELAEGDAVNEADLADMIGVSRTPVREALRQLEAEGLVKVYPYKGCFVTKLTRQDIIDIMDLRTLLEVWCLKKAFKHITEEDLDFCEKAINEAIREHSVEMYIKSDRIFHNMFIDKSGNKRVKFMLETLNAPLQYIRANSLGNFKNWESTTNEHLNLVSYIRCGNQQKSVSLLVSHLKNSTDIFIEEQYSQTHKMT